MPFPKSKRVQYRLSPIRTVVCQLRFPTILRVEALQPVDFQEEIRRAFPLFQEKSSIHGLQIPAGFEGVVPAEMQQLLPQGGKQFDFSSLDGRKTVSLTNNFLSLTTSEYSGWEKFYEEFMGPLNALIRVYGPDSFTRIGLRYQNAILLSELNLSETSWTDLINPQLAGILTDRDVGVWINDCVQVITIPLRGQPASVRVQHGLGIEENRKEQVYLIDSDFFIDQPQEVGSAFEILSQFNRKAGFLFRWAITPRLHEAMGPIPRS